MYSIIPFFVIFFNSVNYRCPSCSDLSVFFFCVWARLFPLGRCLCLVTTGGIGATTYLFNTSMCCMIRDGVFLFRALLLICTAVYLFQYIFASCHHGRTLEHPAITHKINTSMNQSTKVVKRTSEIFACAGCARYPSPPCLYHTFVCAYHR